MEKWLQTKEAINPSLIKWENLGYSKTERFFRIIFTSLVSLALIIITMFVVLGQSAQNNRINGISPQVNCLTKSPSIYTLEAASLDAALGKDSQGVLYCYCKEKLFSLTKSASLDEYGRQFNNKDSICNGFAGRYLLSNLLILGIPLAIVLITYISKTFLRLITAFEKP